MGTNNGLQLIITRKEAIERGLNYYFTGKECSNGHITRRHTKSYGCWRCRNLRAKERQKSGNTPKTLAYRKRRRRRAALRARGITETIYQTMLSEQNGVCALCFNSEKEERAFSVDHDHETGLVRGLLCSQCNRGIGLLKDSPAILIRAAEYIQLHKKRATAGHQKAA
jgi:Recombination endonuclease VII